MSPGRRRGGGGGAGRKAAQLAAQIGRSIEATLVGECRDEVLQNISVDAVEAAPGNRLLVTLRVHAPGAALPKAEVLARVEAQRGLLLERLAQDVARRSLPELSFWLVRDPAAATADVGDAAADDAEDDGGSWDPPSILDDV